jgi:N-acetylmuramoyl-L-alanine amidase
MSIHPTAICCSRIGLLLGRVNLGETVVKFRWLLTSTLSLVLLASPAQAGRLQFWRFDQSQNQLVFTTDEGVQPKAQLLFNPTRLVIDLPGTSLNGRGISQSLGGAMRSLRVGQPNRRTTRIVIELQPGYIIDPQQIIFRGTSPTQWTVQLPTPQQVEQLPNNPSRSVGIATTLEPQANPRNNPPNNRETAFGLTQVQDIRVTDDGFFIRTTGPDPDVRVRSNSDRTVEIDLRRTVLSPQMFRRDIPIDRFGVRTIQLAQLQDSPPVVRITLNVTDNSRNWQATPSNIGVGGIVLLPGASQPPVARSTGLATIEAVEISRNQLIIRSNQPFTYTSGWDRASGAYRLTLASAKLDDDVKEPRLNRNGPLLRLRLRQEDASTVVILLQPAAGIQIGELNQPSPVLLTLPLIASRPLLVPPNNSMIPSRGPIVTDIPRRRRSDGRMVVVIDPGHGGRDPGAIGIGGLQEKDVILPISLQVARQLEQQGIQVILTRRGDYFIDLQPRVDIAKQANADLFVSIHANAINMRRPDVNGIETYYFGSGEELARAIHSSILGSVNTADRRVRRARFYVLRNNPMPAVLVEVGFVTGAEDAPKRADPRYQSQMADAIARGILLYIRQNY